ncbi:MAG TPA: hypothetical protein VEK33_00925 [Terriglobales bacterium]|nr:hypothetical protein [Terriglobales bacterium]
MKSQFQETSAVDAPAVAAFLQRTLDLNPDVPLIAPRHLHWKCWEERADWPGSRGYVLTRGGAIAAHVSVVPLSCRVGQARLRMIHPIDWAADPTSVGSGVHLLKQITQLADAVVVVGGSEAAQKVLAAVGFKTLGEVTKFARPVRPLRRLAGQKASVRTGAQFARSLLWSLQAPSLRREGWVASRVVAEQLVSQAVRWPRPELGTAIFERTEDMVAYFLKCPATAIELYAVRRNGAPRGYFLLAHAPGQTRIADFYVDSEDREAWRAAVELAVFEAKRNPMAAEVVSLGSDAVTRQALLDCGFHARGNFPLRVLPGKGVDLPAQPIRFHMMDNDAAYLHTNQNAYWA